MDGLLQLSFGNSPSSLQCEKGDFSKDTEHLKDSQIEQIQNVYFKGIEHTNPKIKCTSTHPSRISKKTAHYYLGSVGRTLLIADKLSVDETLVFLKKEDFSDHHLYSIEIFGKFSPCGSKIHRYNAIIGVNYQTTILTVRHGFPFDYNSWPQLFTGAKINDKTNNNDIFHQLTTTTNNTLNYFIGHVKKDPFTQVTSHVAYSFTVPQVLNITDNMIRTGTIDLVHRTTFFDKFQARTIAIDGNANCRNFLTGYWFSTLQTDTLADKIMRDQIVQIMNILIEVPFKFSEVIENYTVILFYFYTSWLVHIVISTIIILYF